MPLLKRTVTPARLAANRRAARRSTGPRTKAGKLRSSLNAYRHGGRSRAKRLVWYILETAPVGGVMRTARRIMTPAQLANPDVTFMLNQFLSPGDVPLEPYSFSREKGPRGNSFSANEA
jgi:hypothetical protein